jgi:hypothetical protein
MCRFLPRRTGGLIAAFVLGWAASPLDAQQLVKVIKNDLSQTWPLEHVYFDFKPSEVTGPMTCTIQGVTRPTQEEQVKVDGQEVVRLWTLATIDWKDDAGNPIKKTRDSKLTDIQAVFKPGTTSSPLSIKDEGDYYLINNGTYEFKVRHYTGDFAQPMSIDKVPHWIAGMRVAGTDKWDGRATFQGNALVKGAKTEIVSQGPVHIDIKITIYGDPAPASTTDADIVDAVPLTSGKQSFLYKPDQIPTERLPKLENHYEALIRFVVQDPWIDVSERYHFPRDPSIKPWGFDQEYVDFGGKDGMPIDTAMWVRWFEWDQFGGNTDIHFVPAKQRDAQKGRPFAMLRPIWNQGPGGSQDFFLTTGGETPKFDDKTNTYADSGGKYNPDAPAIGVYAAFPSKWVGPFSQTIVCRAEDGDSGNWRLPMVPAEDIVHGLVPGMYYGQRAYGICVGPRKMFDDTGKINSLVRRHADWTLVALINKYILDWPRDPSKAGPHILVTKDRIEQLRHDYQSGSDTPEAKIIKDSWNELQANEAKVTELEGQIKALKSSPQPGGAAPDAAQNQKNLEDQLDALKDKVQGTDIDILKVIVQGGDPSAKAPSIELPSPELWVDRRYQDDFLNPTSPPVRHITGEVALADLLANGTPIGGAEQAAMAYIVCDPDSWIGYHNGWYPGNPNFHTDKYKSALYLGGAMLDHPDAKDWIEYARLNFIADTKVDLMPPDGVDVECPGYAGYAMTLLLPMASIFENLGGENIPADDPLFKGTGTWHRKLLTPVDPRLGRRHEAPIGDTHRWDEGMRENFGDLAKFYTKTDPAFAKDMMNTWRSLQDSGLGLRHTPLECLLSMDLNIPQEKLEDMDWSSQFFYGFGAIFRDHFGTPDESFLAYKAGPARGHYHNDEQSYHYYALNTPISLDYNCSYHPRGDHAALKNSMTFGNLGQITNNTKNVPVPAQEQLMSTAAVGAFISQPQGDLVVSEVKGDTLSNNPIYPEDAEFQRSYPSRNVGELIYRRLLLMAKHPASSKMSDYLVVRDEVKSDNVPQQVNVHLLARDISDDGRLVEAVGQWGADMSLFVSTGAGPDGADPKIELQEWYYADEFISGLDDYCIHPGESVSDWDKRMDALMAEHGVKELPLPGFAPVYKDPGQTQKWRDIIDQTHGMALVPPIHWNAPWQFGEYQKWVRIETKPGTPVLWVLYPYRKGDNKPTFKHIDDNTVQIEHDGETEEVFMDSAGGVKIKAADGEHVILPADKLPPMGAIKQDPSTIYRGQ